MNGERRFGQETRRGRLVQYGVVCLLALGTSSVAWADEQAASQPDAAAAAGWGDVSDLETSVPVFSTKIYGYLDSYVEKVAKTPDSVDGAGNTVFEKNPHEFDVLNLHLMVQGALYGKYRFFANFAAPGAGGVTSDEGVAVRNAWVEAPLVGNQLQLRFGKTYRPFGLYNETLDAVPTFIGIEPPELFDKDHLMLTRTTNLMLHGLIPVGEGASLKYALTTGNDERIDSSIPIGADLHLRVGTTLKIGTSFYTTNGDAGPSRDVGDGSPRGGVINWMEKDQYIVFGGYGELLHEGLTLQAAYWQANHHGTYNQDALLSISDGLNERQLNRFYVNGDPAQGVKNATVDYAVQTAYLRAGWEWASKEGWTLTPYGQADFYSNPETVRSKSVGGDAEAGLADDGKFWKFTLGAIFRPVPQVALKVDGSGHLQVFNGESIFYPEVRVSLSYLWSLEN